MIRKRIFTLKVSEVYYVDDNLPLRVPTQKQRIDALENCDNNGIFRIRDTRVRCLSGKITRIWFEGSGVIPKNERGDYDQKPESWKDGESVSYSYREWIKEGKPLELRLERTYVCTPTRVVKPRR